MRLRAIIAAGLVLLAPCELPGQRSEGRQRHSLSLFVGAATSSERRETAIAIGPSYRYRLTRHIAFGPVVELIAYQSETSTLVLGGVVLNPHRGVELTLAPGIEWITATAAASESIVERGQPTFRLAAGYAIEARRGYWLSPEAAIDVGRGAATIAYGLRFGTSF